MYLMGEKPLPEIPYANLTPFLQRLGETVTVSDVIPFLNDPKLMTELAVRIKARCGDVTLDEREMANYLGWENVILSSVVQNIWMPDYKISHPSPMSRALHNALLDARAKNRSQAQKTSVLDRLHPTDEWKMVYILPLSIRDLLNNCSKSNIVKEKIVLFLNSNQQDGWPEGSYLSYLDQTAQEGYYLMNLAPTQDNSWEAQQDSLVRTGALRMTPEMYLQAHFSHYFIHGRFPLSEEISERRHSWTRNDAERSIFIRRVGDGDTGHFEFRMFMQSGSSRLKNFGMNECYLIQ